MHSAACVCCAQHPGTRWSSQCPAGTGTGTTGTHAGRHHGARARWLGGLQQGNLAGAHAGAIMVAMSDSDMLPMGVMRLLTVRLPAQHGLLPTWLCMHISAGSPRPPLGLASQRLSRPRLLLMSQPAGQAQGRGHMGGFERVPCLVHVCCGAQCRQRASSSVVAYSLKIADSYCQGAPGNSTHRRGRRRLAALLSAASTPAYQQGGAQQHGR